MQGQICDILRLQLAMNRFLPLWPHRFPHFEYIHLGGGGVGGSDIRSMSSIQPICKYRCPPLYIRVQRFQQRDDQVPDVENIHFFRFTSLKTKYFLFFGLFQARWDSKLEISIRFCVFEIILYFCENIQFSQYLLFLLAFLPNKHETAQKSKEI